MTSQNDVDDMTVAGAVGTRDVPDEVLALTSLVPIGYVDHYVISPVSGADATPEEWARAMFGDLPDLAERLIWRVLLGLRLSKGRSHSTVAGWRIAERSEDWIRLEAESGSASANLVVVATDTELALATFLRFDRRWGLAPMTWGPLSVVHRRLVAGLLRDTVEKLER